MTFNIFELGKRVVNILRKIINCACLISVFTASNYVEIVGSEPFSSEDDCDEDFQNSLMASIVSADEDLTIRYYLKHVWVIFLQVT